MSGVEAAGLHRADEAGQAGAEDSHRRRAYEEGGPDVFTLSREVASLLAEELRANDCTAPTAREAGLFGRGGAPTFESAVAEQAEVRLLSASMVERAVTRAAAAAAAVGACEAVSLIFKPSPIAHCAMAPICEVAALSVLAGSLQEAQVGFSSAINASQSASH